MYKEVGDTIVFDDLRTQNVDLGGKPFVMSELSGGRWEKFNIYLKFIGKYEQTEVTDLENGLKTADLLDHCKKEAVKVLLGDCEVEFLDKEVPPERLLGLIEIQKKLNGLQEVEEMVKNAKSLGEKL